MCRFHLIKTNIWNTASQHIKEPQFEPVAFLSPLKPTPSQPIHTHTHIFFQPPVDKSFSFIAQTQGLQVHGPQKEIQGSSEGGGVGWDGKENGQLEDKRRKEQSPPTLV